MKLSILKTKIKTTTIALLSASIFLFSHASLAANHSIVMEAENLPNGQPAFKMVSHSISGEIITTAEATIPGPTLFFVQGDMATIEITNNTNKEINFNAGKLEVGNSAPIAPGASGNIKINTNKVQDGTYAYHDENSALLGLFGAIVVDPSGGSIQSYVDADGTITPVTNRSGLDKEFVMFMVGSTFWGTEIDVDNSSNTHTPLWTNPTLGSEENEIVRFHVLALGQGDQHHTFHLHAHRWVENQTSADQGKPPSIIDTKLMQAGSFDTHAFTIKAGTGVGPGTWQYHCHLLSHMESGMAGKYRVGAGEVSVAGASPNGAIFGSAGTGPGLVTFEITDEPGSWFRSARGDALAPTTITKSLEVIPTGSSVHFIMSDTNAVHTMTSLLWPADADDPLAGGDQHMIPMDQTKAYKGGGIVKLTVPGLYVFTCKVHPYMFGAVIVDDPTTHAGLDLGEFMDLAMGGPLTNFPVLSDLGIRLLRTFFVATVPGNWQDYESNSWFPQFPNVPVVIGAAVVPDLEAALTFNNVDLTGGLSNPTTPGVGEIWIDTQFEQTAGKTKPGTITVLDATNWQIKRKIALPQINMNHPHNIWSSKDQSIIFQTEWFDNKLTFINQSDGSLIDSVEIGNSPSHVVTVPGSDEITVAINGENGIARIPAGSTVPALMTPTQLPGQPPANPHGHWVTADGTKIMTPNINTSDAGVYNVADGSIIARTDVMPTLPNAPHPIAVGMGKTKFFVANLLDSSLSIFNNADGSHRQTINLLLGAGNYDPVNGPVGTLDTNPFGFLSIQTPVDPTGRVVVTANTGGQITIVDADSETLVAALPCDPGCHGVNFGAKQGGGYYAYVTSKFSNRLIVVDPDPNNDGTFADAAIVGTISMVDNSAPADDTVTGLAGMGGQGIYAIPNPYDGWVQELPDAWKADLTDAQKTATVPLP